MFASADLSPLSCLFCVVLCGILCHTQEESLSCNETAQFCTQISIALSDSDFAQCSLFCCFTNTLPKQYTSQTSFSPKLFFLNTSKFFWSIKFLFLVILIYFFFLLGNLNRCLLEEGRDLLPSSPQIVIYLWSVLYAL